MFSIKKVLFIQKFSFVVLLLNIYQININCYGPTRYYYRPVWKSDDHLGQNEIHSPPRIVLKPSIKLYPSKASFGVVPEMLSDLSDAKFIYQREFSPKLSQIYSQYLKNDDFQRKCSPDSDKSNYIVDEDFESAVCFGRPTDQGLRDRKSTLFVNRRPGIEF